MLGQNHIHRPSLERFVIRTFGSIRGYDFKRAGGTYTIYKYGEKVQSLSLKKDADVFDFPNVTFGHDELPWFYGAGSQKYCRDFAHKMEHTFIVAREVGNHRARNFTSFKDKTSFLKYYFGLKSTDRQLHEIIPPDRTTMLVLDHDQDAGINELEAHNRELLETREILFNLLGLEQQAPVILTCHRTKGDGKDYLSTQQRFPDVTIENFNETMKLILHLLKHTDKGHSLDLGVCKSYQQLRIPGSSKVGSTKMLLPQDATPLSEAYVGQLLVSNRQEARIHITTAQVREVLDKHFGCAADGCCPLRDHNANIECIGEIHALTDQIKELYRKTTDQDPSQIKYIKGSLWNVPKATKCIHGETHKTNRQYIIVKNKHVLVQCTSNGCKETKDYVSLGYLSQALSTTVQPWTKTPRSCWTAISVIDVMKSMQVGVDLYELAKILACVGDFKDLLIAYANQGNDEDTAEIAWNKAIDTLTDLDEIDQPEQAAQKLTQFLTYEPNEVINDKKRKRKLKSMEIIRKSFDYTFDFARFKLEWPSPIALNASKAGSVQQVNSHDLREVELDLNAACLLLHSEMSTGKTFGALLKLIPKHPRIIVVTPKRLFSKGMVGLLRNQGYDFKHYRDDEFWKTDHDLVVVELESLHKVYKRRHNSFDLVVLDESETIVRQMLCLSTHKHNLKANWETLRWLLECSAQTFCADARMSCITMDFVADIFKRNEIHYIHNTHKIPFQVRWFEKSKVMENVLVNSIENNESFYCFTGTRNKALHIDKLARDVYGDEKCRLYTSLNSGRCQNDLLNVDETWLDASAITTSPSITVGTSFNVPDVVKNVFMFLYTKTAGPNDATQGARRVREPEVKVINVAVDGHSENVPTSRTIIKGLFRARGSIVFTQEIDRIKKDYEDEEDQKLIENTIKELEVGKNDEVLGLMKTAVNVALDRNLSLRNCKEQLCRTFLEMGWTIEIVRENINKNKLVAISTVPEKRVFDDHRGALGIVAFYEMQKDELELKEKEEKLSEDEMAVVKLYRYIRQFTEEAQSNHIDYQYWQDYRYTLNKDKRLQMTMQSTEKDAVEQADRNRRHNTEGT
jgi:hypothetical protein